MRFDWEPRPTPEGKIQIFKNQKRDASDQNLKDYTRQSSHYTCRSQWEEASQRKSQLVAQVLHQEEHERVLKEKNNSNSNNISSEQTANLPVVDVLRQEVEEKRALRTTEKDLAARRREDLLQQAAAITATRESQREAQAQENRLAAVKKRDPEVQEYIRKIHAKELAEEWERQQKEKLLTRQDMTRATDVPSTSSSLLHLQGGKLSVGQQKEDKKTKEKLLADLQLQLEESQRRKDEERSNNNAFEALLRLQWEQEKDAATREENEKIESQLEFLESVEIERQWQEKQASERATAEAEAEKRLLADINLRQLQESAKDASAKTQQREDAERELQQLRAMKQALDAKNELEKRVERLRLAQEAQNYAESVKEENKKRRHQAQEILKENQALVKAEIAKKQAFVEENFNIKSTLDDNAGQRSAQIAASKQAQRAEAVLISSQLAAQIAAKEIKFAAQAALEKARQDKNKIIEEERRQLITEAIAAYKILK